MNDYYLVPLWTGEHVPAVFFVAQIWYLITSIGVANELINCLEMGL